MSAHDHDHDHGHGGHDHGHDHGGGHSHGHAHAANETRLGIAAALTGAFMVVEAIGGFIAGSLALVADAGHMLADFGSLALAWFAFRMARWPADSRRTYGFDRMQVLVAFSNGLMLGVVALAITIEAIRRLFEPVAVEGGLMLGVAIAGLAVNVAAYFILHGADQHNLNVRGAALHVLGDMLGSVAALVAALVILNTGWTPIDPILSVVVALIVLRSGWRVVRDSGHILLEGTPHDLDPRAIGPALIGSVAGLNDIHHVHIWSITQERTMTTLHAVIEPGTDPEGVIETIKGRLRQDFHLDHVTVEIETERCKDTTS